MIKKMVLCFLFLSLFFQIQGGKYEIKQNRKNF